MSRAGADLAAAIAADVAAARGRLAGHVLRTPLLPSPWLSGQRSAEVRLKLESLQVTGSFKVRGAANRLLALDAGARRRGVVAASAGNHGLGVAWTARRLCCPATVFVPAGTAAARRAAMAALGAEVHEHGEDCLETEAHARQQAEAAGRTYVSPYNDPLVMAGQGTVAAELLEQWPEVETVYVAVGGGGLLGGMAAWAAAARPFVEWVGCSPANSPAMAECVRRGAIAPVPCAPTLSASTHGGVEPGAVTFEPCRRFVHRWLEVEEPAIAAALRDCLSEQHLLVEGAAAVALAACRSDGLRAGRRAAVVVCGGNLPLAELPGILAAGG